MLWSRGSDTQARTNLRQTLASIRKVLRALGDIILSNASSLRLLSGAVRSDISILVENERNAIWPQLEAIGPLLHGIQVNEPGLSNWLNLERHAIQHRVSTALFKLAEDLLAAGECDEARRLRAFAFGRSRSSFTRGSKINRTRPDAPATYGWIRGQIFSLNGQFEEAIEELMGASTLNSLAQAFLVGGYARMASREDANLALNDFVEMRRREQTSRNLPVHAKTVADLAGGFRAMWLRKEDWEHIASELALAGLSH